MTFNLEALSYVYRENGALADYRISMFSTHLEQDLEDFNKFDGSTMHRVYRRKKEGLAIWFALWFNLPANFGKDLLMAIAAGWQPFKRGKRLKEVPGALEDLELVKAGLKKLSEDSEEEGGWVLQLNVLRYLPEAHILCTQDFEDEAVEEVNDLFQQAERYFLEKIGDEK